MDNFVADAIYVDTPPDVVFKRLLNPEDVLVWTEGEEATVDAQPGGVYDVRRFDGVRVSGKIRLLRPSELIEIEDYYWEKDGARRGPMTLTIALQPRMEGVWVLTRVDGIDCCDNWKRFATEIRKEVVSNSVAMKRHIDQI